MSIIQLKRGLRNNLPTAGDQYVGQPFVTTDTRELFINKGQGLPLAKITDIVFSATTPGVSDQGKLWVTEDGLIKKFNGTEWKQLTGFIVSDVNHAGDEDTVFSTRAIRDLLSNFYSQNEVDEFLQTIETRIDSVEAKNVAQDVTLADHETRLEGVEGEVVEARGTHEDLSARLDAADKATADEAVRAIAKENALQSEVDAVEADLAGYKTTNDARVTGLENENFAQQGEIDAVTAEVIAARGAELNVDARLDKIEASVITEQSRAAAAEGVLSDDIFAEEMAREAADQALSDRATALENGKVDKTEVGVTIAQLDGQGYVPLSQMNPVYREVRVYPTIVERDADTELFEGKMAYVLDGTGDPSVESGAGFYIYDGTSFKKVSEPGDLDAVVDYTEIINKPAFLIALGQNAAGTHLTFNGKEIALSEELSSVAAAIRSELASAVSELEADINAVSNSLINETQNRQNVDAALDAKIDATQGEVDALEIKQAADKVELEGSIEEVQNELTAKAGKFGPSLLAVDEAQLQIGMIVSVVSDGNGGMKLAYTNILDAGEF